MVAPSLPPDPDSHSLAPVDAEERQLVLALRQGDEAAFVQLVERYHQTLVRLAQLYVTDRSVAEEVAQETWLGLLQGLERFEERSSLKTWLFRILTNRAKTRGQRESRAIAFSALTGDGDGADEPAVEPERFHSSGPDQGHWAQRPSDWSDMPEERLLAAETRQLIEQTIATLPPNQRTVITLRDIEGWSSVEVCGALGLSETNQRVLLHRARSRVRRALEGYLDRR